MLGVTVNLWYMQGVYGIVASAHLRLYLYFSLLLSAMYNSKKDVQFTSFTVSQQCALILLENPPFSFSTNCSQYKYLILTPGCISPTENYPRKVKTRRTEIIHKP
jgi:hypothetical protein